MDILREIREYFASTQKGARKIKALPESAPAIVIRIEDEYGVAIQYDNDKIISEKFANCRIHTKNLFIEGVVSNYLILSCSLDSLRYEFATVCAQFVEPGTECMNRINLISNPLEWWQQWKVLLGNSISDKKAYSVVAEMIVLYKLYNNDKSIEWTGVLGRSHDIESNTRSYEVKATVKRYGSYITIAGQHQLQSKKELSLYFCRLEKSKLGVSINDIKYKLISIGYDEDKLEGQLYNLGYEIGSSKRDVKYKILEKRIYKVNENFPKITTESFKDNKIPNSIVQITYTINLDGIEYITW
ncbi:MAG: PD-(D/E)XK motif protein [Clostridium sp.]|uniref:PD-(D/E)XK motif protein n=1 Tax=Clostridium TaxID=1485 RepID=UPI0018A9D00F|nr:MULTISPECIES: PD-(D/E)XK motif protein [Clostridium]MDB2099356.1 PD-(D/E)XK motif protein [Clostridium paraputrificum]MDU1124925.1 PD-(D/E)XK motif protein [Clostridium sp.]MDU3676858.1 PD-(D/E)XK motif protein [Clostridium sp.]MDU6874287.1 PD-(D/E)XK motif protein [Clostridium sp.]MDU6935368.1 PD-(D/E)XK motif protein [Clostridium sp.]